jgi:hypothetical protein
MSVRLGRMSAAGKAGRRVGFPRFRAKGHGHEPVIFQRPRLADSRHVVLDRRLGPLRTKESMRKLARLLDSDPHARVMRSTVQRVNGGWVISFTVERSPKQRRARRPARPAAAREQSRQLPPGRPREEALRGLGEVAADAAHRAAHRSAA